MKFYTVKELYEELESLVVSGLGDRIVLIPDYTEDIDGDFRTIGSIDSTHDMTNRCVYFEYNNDEEEENFWGYKDEMY